jgi:hypothetical protein
MKKLILLLTLLLSFAFNQNEKAHPIANLKDKGNAAISEAKSSAKNGSDAEASKIPCKKRVRIYLRSIEKNGGKHLAMFDSNHNGDIDSLETRVQTGGTVIWKLDRFSRIKSITKIYSKNEDRNVFINDARKRFLCKGFKLTIPKDITREEREEYIIVYRDRGDKADVKIDPYLRVIPPPAE